MPIGVSQFPIVDNNLADRLFGGFAQGQKLKANHLANVLSQIQNQEEQVRSQYLEPSLQEQLQQAIYKNMIDKPKAENADAITQADLALNRARTPYLEAQTIGQQNLNNWYDKLAQANINAKNAGSQKELIIANYLKNYLNKTNNQNTIPNNNSSGGLYNSDSSGNASYQGQNEVSAPSPQDLINKLIFNIDTYTPKAKAAMDRSIALRNEFEKNSQTYNKAAQEGQDFNRLLQQYNIKMDDTFQSGPFFGNIPLIPAMGNAQTVDNLTSQMALGAVEQMRNAMGSARFAVADLNVALGLKPQRNWSDSTRKFYTQFTQAVNNRLSERAKFMNVIRSNPKLNLTPTDAEALWTSYQNNFKISNEKGNEVERANLNKWPLYLTPEAINSVKKTGDYNPPNALKDVVFMTLPDGRIAPIKKDKAAEAIKRGAKPLS